jgi:hypothetical protein
MGRPNAEESAQRSQSARLPLPHLRRDYGDVAKWIEIAPVQHWMNDRNLRIPAIAAPSSDDKIHFRDGSRLRRLYFFVQPISQLI